MDFPIFHLDFMGNRLLIAIIAILHVLINHALAVGFIPLVTILEYLGFRQRKTNLEIGMQWDELARKMMFVGFVITTSIGALTGVGIWFSASLTNPAAIGSLIRVFYSAWFSEWIIFVLEVVFIMLYFLRWKKSNESEQAKRRHIRFGAALSVFSWLTMVIIVAILGFMMDPGNWLSDRSFFSGFTNPLYIPQLYFRTPLAMMMGGAFALFLILIFLKKEDTIREKAISFTSLWLLIWSPVALVGALLYRSTIPESMMGNLPTAVGTRAFINWYDSILLVIFGAVIISLLIALWGFLKPRKLPRPALVIPIIVLFIFLGSFERVREFIRKPFVIGEYMYANGLRVKDYPLYQKNGILPYATYVSTPQVTEENKIEAGKNVFMIACSRCHTVTGINSVVRKFRNITGPGKPLNAEAIKQYIPKMHQVWYYMPPFPGNEAELDALTAFILEMDKNPQYIRGAQSAGVTISPKHSRKKSNREGI
ncbi:MAG: cytochrome c [Candidatus Aminicenantes bacterium]|nr:cytochrome c [Candidatus Aminicenantes bacterium]NIM82956.1 cytochrome c [Candidatus Aminicenantes bacterium]NIN22333.1 cytochrome c [Candidatus Aminicenantes bacterium]NIN46101.1 cytochrome c [Candidatus Aminicenantes bacterium]NIN88937.1 cytochrome c [Candidatus Aminicenantes bacterium]